MEACERRAEDAAAWQGKLHEWLHQAGFQDSDGVGGTADVVLDLELDPSRLDPAEASDWERHCEQRARLQTRIALPPELYPGVADTEASDAPAAESSSAAGSAGGRLQPWLFQGHEIVQASVHGSPCEPPVLFCTGCGASVQKHFRPGTGLAAVCYGNAHPGLAT